MTSLPIEWRGSLIGLVHDVRADNFHIYGRWEQTAESIADFLQEIDAQGEAAVLLGHSPKIAYVVVQPPDEFLELRRDTSRG